MKVAELFERYPELTADAEVFEWLSGVQQRWIGYVRTTRHDGRGWWVLAHGLSIVESGGVPPPARLVYFRGVDGEQLRLEVVWDPDVGSAFKRLPGAEDSCVPDPGIAEQLEAFIARHDVQLTQSAGEVLDGLLAHRRQAAKAICCSRSEHGDPIPSTAAVLGGELAPFQWAWVRYVLDARRAFLADEQGLARRSRRSPSRQAQR